MRASHRLDLVLVPVDRDRPASDARGLVDALVADAVIASDGAPGPAAARWSVHRFARTWLDVAVPGPLALYANLSGGFRVVCPDPRGGGRSIVPAFSAAVAAFRRAATTGVSRGGPTPEALGFRCPACGQDHLLDEVGASPPLAVGPWALVVADLDGISLTAEADERVARAIGAVRVVLRRV